MMEMEIDPDGDSIVVLDGHITDPKFCAYFSYGIYYINPLIYLQAYASRQETQSR